jgi:hypothetical protein
LSYHLIMVKNKVKSIYLQVIKGRDSLYLQLAKGRDPLYLQTLPSGKQSGVDYNPSSLPNIKRSKLPTCAATAIV